MRYIDILVLQRFYERSFIDDLIESLIRLKLLQTSKREQGVFVFLSSVSLYLRWLNDGQMSGLAMLTDISRRCTAHDVCLFEVVENLLPAQVEVKDQNLFEVCVFELR